MTRVPVRMRETAARPEQVAKVIDIAQQFLLYARASVSLARCVINYNTLPTPPTLASTGLQP